MTCLSSFGFVPVPLTNGSNQKKKAKNSREQLSTFETPDRSSPRVQAEAIAQPRNDIGTYDVETEQKLTDDEKLWLLKECF